MSDTIQDTYTRRCIMCGDAFTAPRRTGRPAAFCSDQCKADAKRTTLRYCIICGSQYEGTTRPFYCSDECQQVKKMCVHCGRGCTERYCSHECIQAKYPPPYKCVNCNHSFMPSARWLARKDSLRRIPKYCSQACYEHTVAIKGQPAMSAMMQAAEYSMALRSWQQIGGEPPVRPNGLPYIQVDVSDTTTYEMFFTARQQTAVNYWRWVLQNIGVTPLAPVQTEGILAEYIAYGAFTRGLMGSDTPTGIQRMWTLWPWIVATMPQLPHGRITNMLGNYRQANSANRRRIHAKSKQELMELFQTADAAYRYRTGMSEVPDEVRKQFDRFIGKWLKPRPEFDNNTRLYIECQLYLKSERPIDVKLWMPHLTTKQIMLVEETHHELNQWTVDYYASRRKLPWGQRLTPAEIAEWTPGRFNEMLNTVLTGGLKVKV
jgi:hypothetical protein